jgi:hypothetical protein
MVNQTRVSSTRSVRLQAKQTQSAISSFNPSSVTTATKDFSSPGSSLPRRGHWMLVGDRTIRHPHGANGRVQYGRDFWTSLNRRRFLKRFNGPISTKCGGPGHWPQDYSADVIGECSLVAALLRRGAANTSRGSIATAVPRSHSGDMASATIAANP